MAQLGTFIADQGGEVKSHGIEFEGTLVVGFKWRGVDGEVAVWAKNLADDRSINYPIIIPGVVAAASYQPARTFGVDQNFKY